MLVFFTNLRLVMEFQARYLALCHLFSVIDGCEWFWMGSLSQEDPVNAGVLQGSILGPKHFLLQINDISDEIICNIAIYTGNITKCELSTLNVIRYLIYRNN